MMTRAPFRLWTGGPSQQDDSQTSFGNPVSDVVRFDATTTNHIPAYLEPIYGASGWACTSTTAKADLKHYGYLLSPLCGTAS